jgi:hypothetical protein
MTYVANIGVSAYPRGFVAAVLGSTVVAVLQMGLMSIMFGPLIALYALPYALAGSVLLIFPVSLIGRSLSLESAIFYSVTGAFIGVILLFAFSPLDPKSSLLGVLPGASGGLCWWQFGRLIVIAQQDRQQEKNEDFETRSGSSG